MMKRNTDMLKGPLLPSIISYTIPIMLTNLLQLLFNAADLVVVGRFCGSISVAAVSATGALTTLIVNLFIGLSVGVGVAVAHGLGGNHIEQVHQTVHTALPVSIIGGVFVTVIGLLFSEQFLIWMGTPENVLPLSAVYMKIYFSGMTFTMVYNFCASILRAAGDTKSPLVYLAFSGVINVVLNVIFVTLLHMNVAGVALATIISQAISAILVVIALRKRMDACRLRFNRIRIYKAPLLKIVRIGLPAGIQSSLFSISNVIIQSSVNSFGSDAIMSGNGAAASIEGFLYTSLNSFHQTAVNFIGQNLGAHQVKRIKQTFIYCLMCVTVIGLIGGFAVYHFGEELLSIYITDSSEAISYGMMRFARVALPYFICGLMDISTGALRGLGASVSSMAISVIGVCGIRIAWVYTIFQLPQFHNLESLYTSYLISWLVTFVAQTVVYFIIYNKKAKTL